MIFYTTKDIPLHADEDVFIYRPIKTLSLLYPDAGTADIGRVEGVAGCDRMHHTAVWACCFKSDHLKAFATGFIGAGYFHRHRQIPF